MFQFRRFPRCTYFEFQYNVPEYEPRWVSSFRNLRINAYLQLPEAFRSLSRLSSAPSAKAFALRPCSLDHIKQISFEIGLYPLDSLLPTKIIVTLPFEIVIFLKKELTIIFVSQLLFSFQGTSLSSLFRALKIEQYLINLYLSPVPKDCHLLMSLFRLTP